MSQHPALGISAAFLLALLLAGCSQPTRVASAWHGEPVGAPADQVMVIAVSPDLNGRRMFEDLLAGRLAQSGNAAWASSRKIDTATPLNRDAVAQAVQDTGATLVVVTRLVDRELDISEKPGRTELKVQRRHEVPLDFFRYDYEEIEQEPYLVAKSTVHMSTDVYGVQAGELLYSIDIIIYGAESREEVMAEATRAIAGRLRKDGLVR
jgi:hypothetical protein